MVKIINCRIEDYYNDISEKQLYFFGAGRNLEHCAEIYAENKRIEAIIDNNANLNGSCLELNGLKVPIIGIGQFLSRLRGKDISKIAVLLTSTFYAMEMIEQLDAISELEGLECYLHFLLRCYKGKKKEFQFPNGKNIIPKTIHYCWFGEVPIPLHLEKYIEGWKEKCPDYELICWNEKNYDIKKNKYMYESYRNRSWGFVPDYARLDIIYENGGIYLDTDVEVLQSMDRLLNTSAFFGAGGNDQINLGSGFGAVAGHSLIKEMRDFYDSISFKNEDGSLNCSPCYVFQHPVLRKFGFKIRNEFQQIDDVVIYPAEVLAPTGVGGVSDFFSENTISIHHTELSWITDKERKALERMKKKLAYRGIVLNNC